jgi:hypothetical protein
MGDMNTDLIRNEDEEIIPGTVHLVDLDDILNLKKEAGLKNIILQPQPSSNPNDPLLWLRAKKNAQFTLLFFWAFMQAVCVEHLPLSKEYPY